MKTLKTINDKNEISKYFVNHLRLWIQRLKTKYKIKVDQA